MTQAMADALRTAAETRQNLLMAGGPRSGKTALADANLALPALAGNCVVLIEDTAELQCSAEDRLEMLSKRTDPRITTPILCATPCVCGPTASSSERCAMARPSAPSKSGGRPWPGCPTSVDLLAFLRVRTMLTGATE